MRVIKSCPPTLVHSVSFCNRVLVQVAQGEFKPDPGSMSEHEWITPLPPAAIEERAILERYLLRWIYLSADGRIPAAAVQSFKEWLAAAPDREAAFEELHNQWSGVLYEIWWQLLNDLETQNFPPLDALTVAQLRTPAEEQGKIAARNRHTVLTLPHHAEIVARVWEPKSGRLHWGDHLMLSAESRVRVYCDAQRREVELLAGEAVLIINGRLNFHFELKVDALSLTCEHARLHLRRSAANAVLVTCYAGTVHIRSTAASTRPQPLDLTLKACHQADINGDKARTRPLNAEDPPTAECWIYDHLQPQDYPLQLMINAARQLSSQEQLNGDGGPMLTIDRYSPYPISNLEPAIFRAGR